MQVKKQFKQKIFFLILIFSLNSLHKLNALFDLKNIIGQSTKVDFSFLTSIETKRKDLTKIEKHLDLFKKKSEEAAKVITRTLNNIKSEDALAQSDLKKASELQIEYLNKKINLLNDRKQNLSKTEELWKETEETIEKQTKLIQETIDFLQKTPEPNLKSMYSWSDFKESQNKIAEFIEKLDLKKTKKESLIKQKNTEKETITYLQKQIENKNKEKENILKKITGETEKESREEIKNNTYLLEQEINILNEKVEFANLKIEQLKNEIELHENELELLQYQLDESKNLLIQIEKRLVLDQSDINIAKSDWENEIQKATKNKNILNQQRESKKIKRDKLYLELETLKEENKKIKEEGDEVYNYLSESKIETTESQISFLDKELKLFDSKQENADILVTLQKIQYQIIDLYYSISIEKIDFDKWISSFKNQKNITINELKISKDKEGEGRNSLIEANRHIDSLNSKEEDIKNKKDTIFKIQNKIYVETLTNLSEAKKYRQNELQKLQEYLATVSDLINKQEKIINQYDFIIKDLESRQVLISIWKRSLKAISFDELEKAFIDAEKFFKSLFWNIPLYLNPINILKSIKKLDLNDYLAILILIISFLLSFLGIKKLLQFLNKKMSLKFASFNAAKKQLYFNLSIQSLINFSLNHFKLLFCWFFIYIIIVINPITISYWTTFFYIISIPILLYLSTQLILNIKTLNQKLSFLFFAEKTQSKFLFLISSILYSTIFLIPLRQAFLHYTSTPSEFPNVMLAAYSLILVIVILLFFGKEDVLTLLPSQNKFFIWLKNKIEKYYYPVFIFFMGLLILSNPYIGYSNLSWYLAFAVPSSVFLLYGMFFVHSYIRKYSVNIFLKEEGDEISDKFEHAKTFYGFFVALTFLVLFFFTLVLISRIWRFDYTPASFWKVLSEEWVIPLGPNIKLGIVQFLTLITFIVVGFLISSFTNKFILNKLLDIFRTEPGTQNTISRIFHYLIIGISLILGFATINLGGFILWVFGFLSLGIGLSLKDVVTDFFAGFVVLIERPIEIGNYIQLDEETKGTVHKISARATTIRTAKKYSIIIPNKDFISKPIINWGQDRLAVGFEITLSVSYDSDPEFVKKTLKEIITAHPLILKIPNISIRLEDFEESGIKFFVRAFISSRRVREQWDIASDLRFAIFKAFKENNITIPFPQTVVHFANGENNNSTLKSIDIKFDK